MDLVPIAAFEGKGKRKGYNYPLRLACISVALFLTEAYRLDHRRGVGLILDGRVV